MELEKSIALQKQVRDNADDLRNEFLDMKNWEEQMKKVENELQNNGNTNEQGQLLPPVRKKKSSSRSKLKTKENGSKAKRIKSYDYSAWDNYDVDKACEEVGKESESEDSGDEILSKEELEKNHEEATKHKVMGNIFVQEQKWDKAMACYNEAIKIFPYDAVFYANRALCHLRMDNLYSAEADCTSAIQRDEHYVKAYHRRATARMALKQYKEAIQDLKHLLTLESTNKEAKRLLATAMKYIENSKSVITASNKTAKEEISVEKKEIQINPTVSTVESSKDIEKIDQKKEDLNTDVKNTVILPDWLPVIENDVEIIKPIIKSPHQRSKMQLKNISVTLSNFLTLSSEVSLNPSSLTSDISDKSKTIISPVENVQKNKTEKLEVKNKNKDEEENDIEIPPIPKSSIQFLLTWRKYKVPKLRYKYLKQLPAESIPTLFQDSMESSTFSEILSTLKTQFIPRKDKVFHYLKYLSEIKRFSTLTMFMGKKEKEDLLALLDFCHIVEGQPDTIIKEMRIKYEI
ncbi:hypothetical protein PV325_006022 [Microctonus aethiopoides]|uniref:RNA polymerase II-associated protein 3 n=1 Tax=Microctonus aethiopoides TaxID=144406 RepID=A0AA39FYQ9_9HYME|nr:hypothetical protein PV325_006022 [Microctonus aethiopoides]KAK0177976.1 hypothetical protein PV328_001969 [Microctonus aethiopoides]